MNSVYKSLLVLFLIFTIILSCTTVIKALDVEGLKEKAAKAAVEFVKKKCPEHRDAEIKVVFKYSENVFERLSSLDKDISFVILDEYAGFKPIGNVILPARVKVRGKEDEKVYLRAKVSVIENVIVASKTIRKKEMLSSEDVELAKKDMANYPYRYFSKKSSVLGKQTTSTISKGSIIADWMIIIPPVIERNDMVSIMVRTGNVRAEVQGIALEDGSIGDEVKVRNITSKKEIKAVVVDSGKVEVMSF